MKRKYLRKKLTLTRETIATIGQKELAHAKGGGFTDPDSDGCLTYDEPENCYPRTEPCYPGHLSVPPECPYV